MFAEAEDAAGAWLQIATNPSVNGEIDSFHGPFLGKSEVLKQFIQDGPLALSRVRLLSRDLLI